MAAKVNKSITNITGLVSYCSQSAAKVSHMEFIGEDLERKTDFDESFTNENKPFDNLGPKGRIICNEIISTFVAEMKTSSPQTGMVYSLLKDLPDRLYPNKELCDRIFRLHRTCVDKQYAALRVSIVSKGKELLTDCYCEEELKIDSIFILVEGLTALFWHLTGNSLAPIGNIKFFKTGIFNLVMAGIIEQNSTIHRYLLTVGEKIKPSSEGGKKGSSKKVTESNKTPVLESTAGDDAADLLQGL